MSVGSALQRKMATMYFLLGLLFLKLAHGLLPPTDGNVESHDLNFNLTWKAPSDIEGLHKVSYTVYYAEFPFNLQRFIFNFRSGNDRLNAFILLHFHKDIALDYYEIINRHTSIYLDGSLWSKVPGCVNLTVPFCEVTPVLDFFRDFSTKIILRIEALDESTGATSTPLQVELFPDRNVHLSSPTIAVDQIVQSLVSLRLLGPESPYKDLKEERNLRVEEVAPSLIDQIYYIVKLEGRDIREIKNATARYPYLQFSDLLPGSEYNISAYTEFYGVFETTYSQQTSIKSVYTTLDPKLNKPLDVEIKGRKVIDCTHPDLRDAEITWKRPLSPEHISFYDMNVWIGGREETMMSFVVPSDINRTLYSFSLSNLPRWSLIEVIVFANTSVTGCASFISALYPHAVDEKRSQPENLSAVRTSTDSWMIVWQPPSSCSECIVGYEVSWELAISEGSRNNTRDVVATDVLSYEIFQDGDDVTMVEVSTLLKSGTNMQKTGETAVFGIHYEEPVDVVRTITVCLGVAVLSMVILFFYFLQSKSKKRWKKDPNISDIFSSSKYYGKTNIFLQYSSSSSSGHPYSRSIYVREPEIFDELLPLPKAQTPNSNSVDNIVSANGQSETNPDMRDSGNCDPD